ncbi:hypothetical protein EZS27_003610 [termite gut metagenome]|uniref:Uncharacterized protein n=1 Tax=termite gut metagenome TaxID=433724 RepID=A0A5J4SUY3_9ZZZZ
MTHFAELFQTKLQPSTPKKNLMPMTLQEAKSIYEDAGQITLYMDRPVTFPLILQKAEEITPYARILSMSVAGRRITIIASHLAKEEEKQFQAGSKVRIIKILNELISHETYTIAERQEPDNDGVTYIRLNNGKTYPCASLKLVKISE